MKVSIMSWFHKVTHHYRQTVDDYVHSIISQAEHHPKEAAAAMIEFLALHAMVTGFQGMIRIHWTGGNVQPVSLKNDHAKHIAQEQEYIEHKLKEVLNFLNNNKDARDEVRLQIQRQSI